MLEHLTSCPIAFALNVFGDRWTLLVIRDLAFKGKRSFSELLDSEEAIATNILADRLSRLEADGIVEKTRDPDDGRRFIYRLSETGKDLIPILVEIIVWSGKHDPHTAAPQSFLRAARTNRPDLVAKLRAEV